MISRHSIKGITKECNRTCARTSGKNAKLSLTEEQLKGLLRRYDTDGDGCLSKNELHDAFKSLGSNFPSWRAWRALCHADANRDGCINEDELDGFVKYVIKRGYVIN